MLQLIKFSILLVTRHSLARPNHGIVMYLSSVDSRSSDWLEEGYSPGCVGWNDNSRVQYTVSSSDEGHQS